MTAYAAAVNDANRKEAARTERRIKKAGFRDEVTVMKWADGLIEVTFEFKQRRTTRHGMAGVADAVKGYYGSGTLQVIKRWTLQGRPVVKYGIK